MGGKSSFSIITFFPLIDHAHKLLIDCLEGMEKLFHQERKEKPQVLWDACNLQLSLRCWIPTFVYKYSMIKKKQQIPKILFKGKKHIIF